MGEKTLKMAETFLIGAYWNLLKFTSEQDEEKGGQANDDCLVTPDEVKRYWAILHKTFGRLFLAQNSPAKFD